jgi:hypothetical protein
VHSIRGATAAAKPATLESLEGVIQRAIRVKRERKRDISHTNALVKGTGNEISPPPPKPLKAPLP